MSKVFFGNGVFAGIEFGSKRISTSTDGTNWISRTLGSTIAVNGFGYGGGIFILSGGAGTYSTSEDAINWIKRDALTNHNLGPVSFANGRYFLGGYSDSFSFTSTDANSWQPIQPSRILRSVAYGGGNYVACAPSIWTSRDGTNWISRPVPIPSAGVTLTGLATDNKRIAAAGAHSTGYLIYSGIIGSAAGEPDISIALYPGLTITGTPGHTYRIERTRTLRRVSGQRRLGSSRRTRIEFRLRCRGRRWSR